MILKEYDKKVTTDKVQNFLRRKTSIDSKKTINN